jgi:hypothetical protein
MKTAFKVCLLLAAIAAPAVYAQNGANQPAAGMGCPMMADAADMQKQMGAMMADMRAMMNGMSDPAAKARMHERMNAMMATMQKMHGGMMKAPVTGTEGAEAPTTSPPAAAKEDHEAHHPGK